MQNRLWETHFRRELRISVERIVVAAQTVEERLRGRDLVSYLEVRRTLGQDDTFGLGRTRAAEAAIVSQKQGDLTTNDQVVILVVGVDREDRYRHSLEIV